MEVQDWVAGILWDTHDGREAQSRLTGRGSEESLEIRSERHRWRDTEQQHGRTTESGERMERAGGRPLATKYASNPQAVGCELWSGW